MYIVTVSVRGYSDTEVHGPFPTLDDSRRNVTDGVDRGNDGDETRYEFWKVDTTGMTRVGEVFFHDESEFMFEDDPVLREENWVTNS